VCTYKVHGVANIPLYVTSGIYKTARIMEDIIIIYCDYYNLLH